MARVLLAYGTAEGHTAKIAEHMAETLRALGHEAEVRPIGKIGPGGPADYDALVVGGSLHQGRHQRDVRAFVARHAGLLDARPSAFFSVSLAAASRNTAEREAAMRIAKTFVEASAWRPNGIASFAGALMYTRYGWFKRRDAPNRGERRRRYGYFAGPRLHGLGRGGEVRRGLLRRNRAFADRGLRSLKHLGRRFEKGRALKRKPLARSDFLLPARQSAAKVARPTIRQLRGCGAPSGEAQHTARFTGVLS